MKKNVSHYEIIEKLGAGAMGVVYKARDLKLDRTVALKFLSPHIGAGEEESERLARERFIQEAKAASSLDHTNIGTIYEIGETEDGQTFIAMAFYDGESLKAKISKRPLEIDEAVSIAAQLAEGLSKAHEQGIVHRDIKPANIMVTKDGVAKIIDFGLAKLEDVTRITKKGTTVGTVAYMSPEQARGEAVDHRADIWSLGVVFHEMLTGKVPFPGEHPQAMIRSILDDKYTPVKSSRKDTPGDLERIISHTLEKNVKARYQSAADVCEALDEFRQSSAGTLSYGTLVKTVRRPWVAIPIIVAVLAMGSLAFWYLDRRSKAGWAREHALPEIYQLAEDGGWSMATMEPDFILADDENWSKAYGLAEYAEKYIPQDPILTRVWPLISRKIAINSDPAGAAVYRKYYAIEGDWEFLGVTPIDKVRVPRGYSRIKLEKEGFGTVEAASFSEGMKHLPPSLWKSDGGFTNADVALHLDAIGSIPDDMVHIPAGIYRLFLGGIDHLGVAELGGFLIDKYEVTNEKYKRFVDSGGYETKEYFKYPFVDDGRLLTWEQAKERFEDKTGQPGPADWEVGDYPEGQDDFPVTGISWYEAAAYAEFVGKSLPTVFHWSVAAQTEAATYIIPASNFGGLGPARVGIHDGLTGYGTYDLAGNVQEWCWNASGGDERFISGGGWNDSPYMFLHTVSKPPFDRSSTNGFRCIQYLDPGEKRDALLRPIEFTGRDYSKEKPATDIEYEIYKRLYDYGTIELNAQVESREEDVEDWVRERVSFDAAYGNERVIGYLYLPKNSVPPYQTIVYFPGASPVAMSGKFTESFERAQTRNFDYIVKSGRAVMFPIYKSTYERGDDLKDVRPNESALYREHVIQWVQDFCRSVDYLESRSDIDMEKISYYGWSWGGYMGGLIPAIEERVRVVVLHIAGFRPERRHPEVDPFNFVTRIDVPVLMLGGKYDFFFPVETAQTPMFSLFGTPSEHKRHEIYEQGHLYPRNLLIKEVLGWLDEYLGPVRRRSTDS